MRATLTAPELRFAHASVPLGSRGVDFETTDASLRAGQGAIPDTVTHRYHSVTGPFKNLCQLRDAEAEEVIDGLRRAFGRSLKPGYLARRRVTESWLHASAQQLLRRPLPKWPVYFFLGDFSHMQDVSRPASLQVPFVRLRPEEVTFTLGDSMTVAAQPDARVYGHQEVEALFQQGLASGVGLSDRCGFQKSFIEVQLWGRAPRAAHL
jgi:hypothetical protein